MQGVCVRGGGQQRKRGNEILGGKINKPKGVRASLPWGDGAGADVCAGSARPHAEATHPWCLPTLASVVLEHINAVLMQAETGTLNLFYFFLTLCVCLPIPAPISLCTEHRTGICRDVRCLSKTRFPFLQRTILVKLSLQTWLVLYEVHISGELRYSYLVFCCFAVGPKLFQYVIKVIVQAIQLLYTMLKIDQPSYILLQVCFVLGLTLRKINSTTVQGVFSSLGHCSNYLRTKTGPINGINLYQTIWL